MANVYVDSNAAGGGTGADWANAYTTLVAAMAAKAAGDIFWVAHNHVETTGASNLSLISPGTEATPCKVYCVSSAGSVPPVEADLATTASLSVTGSNSIIMNGTVSEWYGINFNAGSAGASSSITCGGNGSRSHKYRNCTFRIVTTNTAARINVAGNNGSLAEWENCTVQFANASQAIAPIGRFTWKNTPNAIVLGTAPNSLFVTSGNSIDCFVEGVDLSALTSKTLVTHVAGQTQRMVFKDCELGSGMTIQAGTIGSPGNVEVLLVRCDSGDVNYRLEKHTYSGSQTTETTIVMTGGATDGVTPVAHKVVTTSACKWQFPFEFVPITIWNEDVGSPLNITIEGIWGGGAVPDNDEIWMVVEYLGTSGVPLGSFETTGMANGLGTPAATDAGSGTWGGSTTEFSMTATVTPQEKGPITIYIYAGVASSTFYIDPKPIVS